jgi:hypothetical protein
VANFLDKFPRLFTAECIKMYYEKHKNEKGRIMNLLSIRNGILLYKALNNEKIRDVYLCVNGQVTFKQKYP